MIQMAMFMGTPGVMAGVEAKVIASE